MFQSFQNPKNGSTSFFGICCLLAACPQQPRATDDFWQVANSNLKPERIRTMEQYIYDENNGLWYELHGDYYLPCLTVPEEERQPIGIWGKRHHRYLKENHRALCDALLLKGELNRHLAEVDQRAEDLLFELVKQLAQKAGITEQLKATNQMEWVRQMNVIHNQAEEIVYHDVIYTL